MVKYHNKSKISKNHKIKIIKIFKNNNNINIIVRANPSISLMNKIVSMRNKNLKNRNREYYKEIKINRILIINHHIIFKT